MHTEFGPFKYRQARVDGGRIEGIDMMVKLENLLDSFLACLVNHIKCKLLEDAVITLLVSFAKVTSSYRFAHSEMIKFGSISFGRHNQIAQTLTIT